MAKIAIIGSKSNPWAESVCSALRQRHANDYYFATAQEIIDAANISGSQPRCLYVPRLAGGEGVIPDLAEAEAVFQQLAQSKSGTIVLLSSALIYGTGPGRQAFVGEEYFAPGNDRRRICDRWASLEQLAEKYLSRAVRLTVLRPVAVLPSPTIFSRLLARHLPVTLPGHDPCFQFLSRDDLAQAIECALERDRAGVFNIAPDDVVPLHAAIRLAGKHRMAIPRTMQRLTKDSDALEYLRYSWTVSPEKAKRELGFNPARSSVAAVLELSARNANPCAVSPRFDDFGMDKNYIQFYGKNLFRFLCDFYWRIEVRGLEHVPRQGRGILVGVHRGFMPWDGVMALHILAQRTGRYPRFLTHPGLLKFPFLANFMTKMGGIVAWQQSADRVLEDNELLGVFPEGVQGAFTFYRNAYQLKEFGRDAYVKMALRNRAPLLPFVTVGSAEIFPILAKIKSRLWTRYTDWPCLPLAPPFPLLPVPLPSKWHTQFLPAMHIEKDYPPEAAQNPAVVKAIGSEVRAKMQQAINEMLGRRKWIFFGSIFDAEDKLEEIGSTKNASL